jgi:predicted nucleic acid-binding protein
MYLSVVSLFEVEVGVLLMERRDKTQGALLRQWMSESVLQEFDQRILITTPKIALRCAGLHVPDKRPERDAWIAATALVHGVTVVTRNVVDFQPMGVAVLNPWEY